MISEEDEPLNDREKRYHNRSHNKYDYTTDDQDNGKAPETGSDKEGEEFARTLLVAMQDLAREIKEMRIYILKESPRRPHHGESSGMSHHWNDQPVNQTQAPQCSIVPTFLAVENEGLHEQVSLEEYFEEYESQNQRFKDHLIFQEFFHLKDKRRPRYQYRDGGFTQNHDQHLFMGRLFLPKFDGSSTSSAKAWVEKLDIYLQLNKVPEMEAIKIAVIHFEGEAHNWWFHGLSTLVHANVTTYFEFTRILVERFDRKDLESPFMSLAKLKQSGNAESYISEFLRLFVMVRDLSAIRRVCMFINGLDEPLHGLVKSTKPITFHDAIERARDLQGALPKA